MKRPTLTRRVAVGCAVTAAVAAGGSAAALATDNSPSNVYQGCLRAGNGDLYHVMLNPSSPPSCNPRDTLVSWNQTGPKGDTGPQGPKGDTGAIGPPGVNGDAGATGQPGADGKTVLNGTGAPTADQGSVGDFYIDTSASAIYGPKTDGGWGNPTSLVGPKGDKGDPGQPGADGKTVLNGAGAPSSGQGGNGDFYIDTSASAIYGPKTDTGWGNPTSLVGPKGDKGDKGDTGPQGPPGVTGLKWVTVTHTVAPHSNGTDRLTCGSDEQVYGGGAWIENGSSATVITESAPSGDLTGWYVHVENGDLFSSYTYHAYALCGPSGLTLTNLG
jgi:hypothetical protein